MILYNTAYGFFIQNNTAFTNLKIHSLALEGFYSIMNQRWFGPASFKGDGGLDQQHRLDLRNTPLQIDQCQWQLINLLVDCIGIWHSSWNND